MIEQSEFGAIQIDGKIYTTDIIIYPDGRVSDHWWRRHGHRLAFEDMDTLIASEPDIIVIGSGVSGRMLPEPGLEKILADRGIELVLAPTGDAVSHFNRLQSSHKTGAGLHLTC